MYDVRNMFWQEFLLLVTKTWQVALYQGMCVQVRRGGGEVGS